MRDIRYLINERKNEKIFNCKASYRTFKILGQRNIPITVKIGLLKVQLQC